MAETLAQALEGMAPSSRGIITTTQVMFARDNLKLTCGLVCIKWGDRTLTCFAIIDFSWPEP